MVTLEANSEHIRSLVRHLRWKFLQEQKTASRFWLFLQKATSLGVWQDSEFPSEPWKDLLLIDSNAASKTYWSILNRFLYNKKIPAIPPLLVDGNFISDFCEKANLFNNFFASICTPIKNNSRLIIIFPPYINQDSIVHGQIHVTLILTYLFNNENYNSVS